MLKKTDCFMTKMFGDTEVTVYSDTDVIEISNEEVEEYIKIFEEKENKKLEKLRLKPDGEYMECEYETYAIPFERIRRITGYLVGTLENWNNAKRAEERDRVKHGYEKETDYDNKGIV